MATKEQYIAVRHIIQYILVPTIFVIGFLGNTLSIIVLTRKRMRCSTNLYLTGLAVADIVYLTMLLIMSAQHYKATEQIAIFWRCRGLFQWLIDGSSYISLYIVVCFTIERYIAVCHPMKGQVFCTEERAKKVLAVIVIVILLSILSANFEFELVEYDNYVNDTNGELCDQRKLNQTDVLLKSSLNRNTTSTIKEAITLTTSTSNIPDDQYYYDSSTLAPSLSLLSLSESDIDIDIRSNTSLSKGNLDKRSKNFLMAETAISTTEITLTTGIKKLAFIEGNLYNSSYKSNSSGCHYIKKYKTKESALALNEIYRKTFDIFSIIIYSFVPLILIIIFNTFLIRAVQKSNRLRNKMTNMSVRQIKQQQQENKITIILIAVVILFIICQTPWAIYLFVDNYTDFMDGYLKRICGNIFNTLAAIDAASNFILYCVLSDKYRKTLKELLMGYKYKRQDTLLSRRGTLASSWYNYSYKSFKKKPNSNPNLNMNSDNSNRNHEVRKSMLTTDKQKSCSSLSESLILSPNQKSSINFVGKSTNVDDSNSNIISADAIVNAPDTANKTKSGTSSSFRHKLSNNDKHRLQLRPTVSFYHPSQKLSLSASPTKSFSVPFNYGQQQRQKSFSISTTPVTGMRLEQQKGFITKKKQQDSTTAELAFGNNNNDDANNAHSSNGNDNKNNYNNGVSNIEMTNLLKSSDSSGSLTRSQSLIIQPKTKHSPDCPSFDSSF